VVSIDGLFACGPVFEMCRKHNWKFMVVLKDRSLPTVNQEFESLSQLQAKNRLTRRVSDGKRSIEQTFRWVKEINYTDTEKNEHTLDVIECLETGEKAKGVACTKKFKWVTNLSASERNVVKLTYNGGRLRWKIENEGFNVQKNGGYGLTHMYSNNDNSSKIFHFLMQIAHLWMQLLVKGGMRRWFPKGVGSVKNVAFRLLEGWRNTRLPRGILQWITGWRFQIRFCFDTS
jgi:hypothetical protein